MTFVSVVMPAYNHAPFVVEAMRSVLDQDFEDLELLVADDGSLDGTADAIRSVQDPRITFFDNRENRGASTVHNELIDRASGKYVAVMNSDDAWLPRKLSTQIAFLESHSDVAACFGRASFIDRNGMPILKSSMPFGHVFDETNRSRGAWLRRFFARGNCLCHPTLLIRRDAYSRLGPYDNRLRQLPDFDMWIRLVKQYKMDILEEEMIRFRILPGENASENSRANYVRTMNEHYFIARRFFDGVSGELLRQGFSDVLKHKEFRSDRHLEVEKTLLYLTENSDLGSMYKVIGITRLHDLLQAADYRDILRFDYGIDDKYLQKLAAEADAFRPPAFFVKAKRFLPQTDARELGNRVRVRLGRWIARVFG